MSDHDDGSACRVVVTPTVGDVEQAPAGDECTVFPVNSRSTWAPASSTRNEIPSFGVDTATSPAPYQSNSSPGWSFGSAMNPSSDIVMWVNTLPIVGLL
jgi:hypothetical protein